MDCFLIPNVLNGEEVFMVSDEKMKRWIRQHISEVTPSKILPKEDADLVRHNQFFAILSRCVESMDTYQINNHKDQERAVDDLLIKLKYAVGFTSLHAGINGEEIVYPRSIAFGECSEEDREVFRSRAYNVLCTLLGCTMQEIFEGAI